MECELYKVLDLHLATLQKFHSTVQIFLNIFRKFWANLLFPVVTSKIV